MRDPVLCALYPKVISKRLQTLSKDGIETRKEYIRLAFLMHDLKYMCKPLVAPRIVSETDFVQQLLLMMKQLHFVDNV